MVSRFMHIIGVAISDFVREVATEVSLDLREEIYQEVRVNVDNEINTDIYTMVEYDIHRYSNATTYDKNNKLRYTK